MDQAGAQSRSLSPPNSSLDQEAEPPHPARPPPADMTPDGRHICRDCQKPFRREVALMGHRRNCGIPPDHQPELPSFPPSNYSPTASLKDGPVTSSAGEVANDTESPAGEQADDVESSAEELVDNTKKKTTRYRYPVIQVDKKRPSRIPVNKTNLEDDMNALVGQENVRTRHPHSCQAARAARLRNDPDRAASLQLNTGKDVQRSYQKKMSIGSYQAMTSVTKR